jgi:hypothetical protein
MKWVWQYLAPGIALVAMAFYAGSQRHIVLALFGFLSFFSVGVTLIIEGIRKINSKDTGGRDVRKSE